MKILLMIVPMMLCVVACAGREIGKAEQDEYSRKTLIEYQGLSDRFDNCVLRSSKFRFASIPDKSAAVEYGFDACRTEETAFKIRLTTGISANFAVVQMEARKSKLKAYLVTLLPATGLDDISGKLP